MSSKEAPCKARKGDIVTIDYKLDSKGNFVSEPLFDTQGIVSFALGWGNYLPGLHDLIEGMTEGESVSGVNIDAGWGERNPNLIFKVPKADVQNIDVDALKIGTELLLQSGHKVVVSDITDDYLELDANPPLAGASYECTLKLLRIDAMMSSFLYRKEKDESSSYQAATFALGCFWGGELAYMREPGVVATKVGYTQGSVENPTYEQVCEGETGHAEAIQVVYDPKIVSYERLVHIAIDRLGDSAYQLNQVGNDKGTQYRHGIYYHNDDQLQTAKKILGSLGDECVTELKPAVFYDAEDYHQQYLLKGGQSAKKGATEHIRCYG